MELPNFLQNLKWTPAKFEMDTSKIIMDTCKILIVTFKIMMGKIVLGTYKILMGKIVLGTYKIMMGKIVVSRHLQIYDGQNCARHQGYIVRFGQCSVFLIPINKRRRWKLVLSLTDGALYCS
jgi:hypothetical protein